MVREEKPRILVLIRSATLLQAVQATLASEVTLAVESDAAAAALTIDGLHPPDLAIIDGAIAWGELDPIRAAVRAPSRTRYLPVLALLPGGDAETAPGCDWVDEVVMDAAAHPQALLARVRTLLRIKQVCDNAAGELKRLTEIGIALGAEHNLHRLLDRIVNEARAINHAEAGTLYSVDRDAGVLRFQIFQNERQGTHFAGREGNDLPPVPLNPKNVSAYVALTGEIVNIPDVYEAEGFDFSGPRKYDAMTGYRSRSMLVVPIRSREEIIGVLQLINARDPRLGEVAPFHGSNVERTCALASQAGVALTNARLINDLQALLEGLIQMMATAIDEKSAYTAGHVRRVTRLALLLAEAVNGTTSPEFAEHRFTASEMEELRIAGLLHDIGKIVVPEYVVDKATKLQTIRDRIEEIRVRFELIGTLMENGALRRKFQLAASGALASEVAAVDGELSMQREQLAADLAFIEGINRGGEHMAPEKLERLAAIANRTYWDARGREHSYLTQEEVRNLSISRGTLLPEELAVIRSHAAVSYRLLQQIPFPRQLSRVPTIAGEHHETLNGTGYPDGKTAETLSLQSRILAIADIFDALSAADRPYKKAFSLEVCHRILREEAERGKLDAALVELFIASDCHGRLLAELASCPDDPSN